MLLTRIAAADGGVDLTTAVTLAEAKQQLDVMHPNDDALIGRLIKVAQSHLEGHNGTGGVLGRPLSRHMFDGVLPAFPRTSAIVLPCPPLVSVSHIKYFDTDGVEQTLDAAKYKTVSDRMASRIVLAATATWPQTAPIPDAVTIRFTCGPASGDVPEDLKHAMLLHIAHLFNARGYDAQEVRLPMAYDSLIAAHKTHGWI